MTKFIVLLSFSLMNLSLIFSQDRWVLTNHNAPFYQDSTSRKIKGRLSIAHSIVSKEKKGKRFSLEIKGNTWWMDQSDFAPINFNEKNFSTESVFFSELVVEQDGTFWFTYNNGLYSMGFTNIEDPSVQKASSLPNFSSAFKSPDSSWVFLTGDVQEEDQAWLNLALFHVGKSNFIPLTFFDASRITLQSTEFSSDSRYIFIFFALDQEQYLHVYDVETQEKIYEIKDFLDANWVDSSLIITQRDKLLSLSFDSAVQETVLYTYDKKLEDAPDLAQVGKEWLIDLHQKVYRITKNNLIETDYRSVERSINGVIEHYTRNETFYTTYQGERLRSLSGKTPRWTFMSIVNDNQIMYRRQEGALQIIALYNGETDESEPYYWIEEPFYVFPEGIVIEAVVDKGEVWLFLEKAGTAMVTFTLNELIP